MTLITIISHHFWTIVSHFLGGEYSNLEIRLKLTVV